MNPFDEEDNNVQTNVLNNTKVEIWLSIDFGKKNTHISGLNYDEATFKEHIKNLKKKLGCNGTLKNLKDTDNDEAKDNLIIILQGNHVDTLYEYFENQGIKNIIIKVE